MIRIDNFSLKNGKSVRADCTVVTDEVKINYVRLIEYEREKFSISYPYFKDNNNGDIHQYVIVSDLVDREVYRLMMNLYLEESGSKRLKNDDEIEIIDNVEPVDTIPSLKEINQKLKKGRGEI
jgi:hypothetical protein